MPPAFVIYDYDKVYNRIGSPRGEYDEDGEERIFIDPGHPAIYYMQEEFNTSRGRYTNWIYRVYFPGVPFRLITFYLNAGRNVGLIVVVTLDQSNRAVVVSTVGTCGCYRLIVPTTYLPRDAFPENWRKEPQRVRGERLPWILDFSKKVQGRLIVYLRPGVHRVMNLEIIEDRDPRKAGRFRIIVASLRPMAELEKIPIDATSTSFFYQKGPLRGM